MRRALEVGLCVAVVACCRASERGEREVASTPSARPDSGVGAQPAAGAVTAAAGSMSTTTGASAQIVAASEAVSPEERGAGAAEPSDAVAAAKLDVGAPVDAAPPDTCAKPREDAEDGEVSMTACRILEGTELAGWRLEVVEVELDDPSGADEVREVYVAMRADVDAAVLVCEPRMQDCARE